MGRRHYFRIVSQQRRQKMRQTGAGLPGWKLDQFRTTGELRGGGEEDAAQITGLGLAEEVITVGVLAAARTIVAGRTGRHCRQQLRYGGTRGRCRRRLHLRSPCRAIPKPMVKSSTPLALAWFAMSSAYWQWIRVRGWAWMACPIAQQDDRLVDSGATEGEQMSESVGPTIGSVVDGTAQVGSRLLVEAINDRHERARRIQSSRRCPCSRC